jgi:hypothetical protein
VPQIPQSEWATPIRPIPQGELFCCFNQRGVYEFFVHPKTANAIVDEGGMRIDGHNCKVELLPYTYEFGASHLRATRTNRPEEWVDASMTKVAR